MSNEYRLHIDIPMGLDEGNALKSSEAILALLQGLVETGQKVQYRLGNDEDRQSSNYFQKNENGHVSNKKSLLVSNKEPTGEILHHRV